MQPECCRYGGLPCPYLRHLLTLNSPYPPGLKPWFTTLVMPGGIGQMKWHKDSCHQSSLPGIRSSLQQSCPTCSSTTQIHPALKKCLNCDWCDKMICVMFIVHRLLESNLFHHLIKRITVQTFFASCNYSFSMPLVSAIGTASIVTSGFNPAIWATHTTPVARAHRYGGPWSYLRHSSPLPHSYLPRVKTLGCKTGHAYRHCGGDMGQIGNKKIR